MVGSNTQKARATPAAARVVKPQARTAERRQAVLEAAMAVFGSRGYHNGSLQEIAQQAGMTHAGVLHHFGSKERLLIDLLEYRDRADVAELEGHRAPTGAAFLDHLVETVRQNVTRPGIVQAYAVLSGEAVTDEHPAHDFFAARLAGLREMVQAALADRTGRAPDDARILTGAASIIAIMDGLQIQWLLAPDSIDMPNAVRGAIEAIVASIGDGEPTSD